MNIVQELVTRKIADNDFHAAGMLNVLECYKLETDEQRIARCELYKAWCEYYKEPKKGGGFKISKENKQLARAHAIAGKAVLSKYYWQHEDTGNVCVSETKVPPSNRWYEITRENYNAHETIAGDHAPAPMEER